MIVILICYFYSSPLFLIFISCLYSSFVLVIHSPHYHLSHTVLLHPFLLSYLFLSYFNYDLLLLSHYFSYSNSSFSPSLTPSLCMYLILIMIYSFFLIISLIQTLLSLPVLLPHSVCIFFLSFLSLFLCPPISHASCISGYKISHLIFISYFSCRFKRKI